MRLLRNMGLAVLAGLLMALAFPDTNIWPFAIAAIVVLWFALGRCGAWAGVLIGWAYGTAFMLPHTWWANSAVGPVPWIALSLASGLFYGLFGGAWASVRRSAMLVNARAWAQPLAFAVLFGATEELRSILPFGGFPWGRVAFSQSSSPFLNLAWAGGALLVTLAVVLTGAVLALAIEAGRARRWGFVAVCPVVAIGLGMAGIFVPLSGQAEAGKLSVGVVQGNVPNAGLDAFQQAREVTQNHLDETERLVATAPGPYDVMIWPENSADYDPRVDPATYDMVTAAAVAADAPLLFGTQDLTPEEGRYNVSLLWSKNGTVLDEYRKQRPAPFAEYIPIRGFARHFSDAVDRVTKDVLPGEGPATMDLQAPVLGRSVTLSTIICFEVVYDEIVRQSVRDGGEIIIVQTNNASFGMTAESTQQLAMTKLRAIEYGRTAIQASTVGVSAIVLPDGRVTNQTELFTQESMAAEVPLRTSMTPASYLGGVERWVILALGALIPFFAMRKRLADKYEW
ncbi:apolipoprotein N-acyltransferase [Demequina sp.]|uniref:apolipoprotein N-acyltransferase n=1 Tax=Demequina sp. TaxID=2050685 RepID=UPI003D0BCE32